MTVTLSPTQVLAILRDISLSTRSSWPPTERDQLVRLCRRIAVDMAAPPGRTGRWRSATIELVDEGEP